MRNMSDAKIINEKNRTDRDISSEILNIVIQILNSAITRNAVEQSTINTIKQS